MALVYTVGHSTRKLEAFLDLLRQHGIQQLVDVRRFPASRRHPHFAREPLAQALSAAGIGYVHEPALGGWRSPRPGSPNTAWRQKSFQGYADHMDTPEFRAALERVIAAACPRPTAVMCAEITPWRCHRQLIADALVVRGHAVGHIVTAQQTETHRLHPGARALEDGRLVYAGPAPLPGLDAES
ncbi:DUF488 domain-containing protein [Pelomicrobium methylotrophicum]|uniref:DUF488 domain-containing protein n=2 Tax=Pelomicrobium methylotrophicum TaxID=2602750 RepID=A0A5C7EK89_9PROT|nr:DUF488 domain-containing protein [Pelomicrobium methylotrophicum]